MHGDTAQVELLPPYLWTKSKEGIVVKILERATKEVVGTFQKKKGFGFANPLNHFYSFYAGEELVGFINLYEEETEVFFGIGVAPAHCGKGYGRQMTEIACTLSRRLFPGKPLYLEVRTWNTRAVRCYQKAGFRIVGEPLRQTTSLGEGLFYRMVAQ